MGEVREPYQKDNGSGYLFFDFVRVFDYLVGSIWMANPLKQCQIWGIGPQIALKRLKQTLKRHSCSIDPDGCDPGCPFKELNGEGLCGMYAIVGCTDRELIELKKVVDKMEAEMLMEDLLIDDQ